MPNMPKITKLIGGRISKRMERKWVAIGKTGGPVIAFGNDPVKVLNMAKKRGYDDPIICFLPKATDVLIGGRYQKRSADGLLLKPINKNNKK